MNTPCVLAHWLEFKMCSRMSLEYDGFLRPYYAYQEDMHT